MARSNQVLCILLIDVTWSAVNVELALSFFCKLCVAQVGTESPRMLYGVHTLSVPEDRADYFAHY
ncbi:hypothetical protein CPB83DRAFT_857153 [Crepidotus variabilis]|uniref:Secreted protein n=1 Tax=Crepidotus variabilis TaxID=179855 RepID=A0A9P6EDD3_9AGAR|nr:hypothetical protein CPB83DRAFT_857153 [Crepidotus variabilis]